VVIFTMLCCPMIYCSILDTALGIRARTSSLRRAVLTRLGLAKWTTELSGL
jgi:hypothetical protein